MKIPTPNLLALTLLATMLTIGCDATTSSSDPFVQEAALRQAEQSQTVAENSREVAKTSQALVASDGVARQEVIALQRDLRADQAEIAKERDLLERERQELAERRRDALVTERRESVLASLLTSGGIIAACLSPLLLAAAALWALWRDGPNEVTAEVLLMDLQADEIPMPNSRPSAPALPGTSAAGLAQAALPPPSA